MEHWKIRICTVVEAAASWKDLNSKLRVGGHANPHHQLKQRKSSGRHLASQAASQRERSDHGDRRRQRAQRPQRHRQQQQDAAQERRPVQVCPGHDGAAARAGVHARPAPPHGQAQVGVHAVVAGRGAAAGDADQDGRRQEHHRGGRVHGLLAPRHRARAPRRRQGRGDRLRRRELRGGAAVHQEGRRGAQGGLPRGLRARSAGRAPRRGGRGGARGAVRLRVRGRRQAQLRPVPRAAAAAGARGRHHRVRQHVMGGTVALPPDAPMSDLDRRFSVAIRDLNAKLAADPRIEVCQLAIADGVTICRRLV